jgi:hypothetical protein
VFNILSDLEHSSTIVSILVAVLNGISGTDSLPSSGVFVILEIVKLSVQLSILSSLVMIVLVDCVFINILFF